MSEPQDNAHNTGLHPNHVYNINVAESGTIKQDLNNKKHDKNKHTNKRGRIELNKAGYNPQKISLTILGNILKGVL